MQQIGLHSVWTTLNSWRKRREAQIGLAWGLSLLAPALIFLTYYTVRNTQGGLSNDAIRLVLLLDFIYVLVVASLVGHRVLRVVLARSRRTAGSRLHLRLSSVFAFVALMPTVLVAVISTIVLNFGFENWFSDSVQKTIGNSLAAAEAYEASQQEALVEDARRLAVQLNLEKRRFARAARFMSDAALRDTLRLRQQDIQRGLKEAFIIDGVANLKVRGDRSYLFDFEPPLARNLLDASEGRIVVIKDWDNNEFRVLLRLTTFADRYLYVSRTVDGTLLNQLEETQATARFYQNTEQERDRLFSTLALLYMGFALIVILAAIWVGLWFAERLAGPVGRLAGAAQRVGAGDLDVRVTEDGGDDEIAMLGRIFNRMTQQVKRQHDDLRAAGERTERRRRLFDSVLSSVTAGVIGLNARGEVELMNAAAERLLGLDRDRDVGAAIGLAVPEFTPLFDSVAGDQRVVQREIRLTRADSPEILLVRIAARTSGEEVEGYVVTFDDVTDLVSAQRMAAWGDVARRIAHEIKNPLTPIQLSAERVKRKFGPLVGDKAEDLEQYTDVIVRQTGDLRRIVDEFSKFARMPEPQRAQADLTTLLRDSTLLQKTALAPIEVSLDAPDHAILADLDETMIGQALTNLIKNAGEAVAARIDASGLPEDVTPEIRVHLGVQGNQAIVTVADNGIGLPAENRSRLFEPYVTYRDEGTGLGLPIVKKIIEEHGGTLDLTDADPFDGTGHRGAVARITLPVIAKTLTMEEKAEVA